MPDSSPPYAPTLSASALVALSETYTDADGETVNQIVSTGLASASHARP